MKIYTVDTLENALEVIEEREKSLYLLRPNNKSPVFIDAAVDFGIQFSTKIIPAFVNDNFPEFITHPLDDRVAFGKFLLSGAILESDSHVFVNQYQINLDNPCLTAFLNVRYKDKGHIAFTDSGAPLPSLGGLSVSALYDIGIVEIRTLQLTYPIKLATRSTKGYENYVHRAENVDTAATLLNCA